MLTQQAMTKLALAVSIVLLVAQTVFMVWYYFAAFKPHCL